MRHTLLLLFLAISFNSTAQEYEYVPFPTEGAVWNVDQFSSISCGNWPGFCSTPEFTVTGDSVFNGTFYHLLTSNVSNEAYYFREDTLNRRIYVLAQCWQELECLAYDFSLQVGDTMYAPLLMGGSNGVFHTIASIDTISFNDGTLRKRFNLLYSGVVNAGEFWIEGMGGNTGPFQHYNFLEKWNELRCFTFADELLYSDPPIEDILLSYPWYEYCDPTIVGITDQPPVNNTITAYPNPAIEVLELKYNDSADQINAVTIFSLQGEQMHYEESTAPLRQVNVANLPSGFYILKITTDDNRIRITKFMKL